MDQSKEIDIGDLGNATDDLHINAETTPPPASESELNPWREQVAATEDSSGLHEHILHTPDPSTLDSSTTRGLAEELGTDQEGEKQVHVSDEVLLEFDPLASSEEQAAREAWASSTGHPPPPHSTAAATATIPDMSGKQADTPSSTPQSPSTPNRSISPIPAFPALAALARTFAIPLASRGQRPRSLDTATAVPSPATLSSFAEQQQSADLVRPPPAEGLSIVPGLSTSGRSTPSAKGKDQEIPPFDFQKFLDQMKLKGAEPVAKYLRSFLSNFAKRTFTVNDQVKLISDFLNFISERMRETDVWRNATDAEFDNVMEGMEKLVMNRLYDFTFTPQVARMVPPRPVTADDLERDRVLSQRISLFGWIDPKHLDVPEGEGSAGFLMFAQQELMKINHYKAPRDKLICILNCCKVIFGLIRHLHREEGADTFVPILIYVVVKANPPHLLSNVEFISRFRNPIKLQSEAGYYLSSLMGAVSFVETMDHTSLSNLTQEEFEKNVEDVIQSLPSTGSQTPEPGSSPIPTPSMSGTVTPTAITTSHAGEESAQPLALPTPSQTLGEDARRFLQKTGDTISKPLNAIGRIFSEVLDGAEESFPHLPGPFAPSELSREQQQQQRYEQGPYAVSQTPAGVSGTGQRSSTYDAMLQTPYKPRVRRVPSPQSPARSSASYQLPSLEETPSRYRSSSTGPYTNQALAIGPSQSATTLQQPRLQSLIQRERDLHGQSPHVSRTPTPNLDLAGLQDEIDRAHEKAAEASRETLRQIFPTTDVEVVEWVLEANEGDLGKSIEALLEMSSGT